MLNSIYCKIGRNRDKNFTAGIWGCNFLIFAKLFKVIGDTIKKFKVIKVIVRVLKFNVTNLQG